MPFLMKLVDLARLKSVTIALVTLSIVYCVYTPKAVTVYDEACEIVVRHMELESKEAAELTACKNEHCVASILVVGLYSVGSIIISGSIMVAHNAVYWFDKQGDC